MNGIKYTLSCVTILIVFNGVVYATTESEAQSQCNNSCISGGHKSGTIAVSNPSGGSKYTNSSGGQTLEWNGAGSISCVCSD